MPSPNRLHLEITLVNDKGDHRLSFDTIDYVLNSGKVALYPIEIRLLQDIIVRIELTQRYHPQETLDAQAEA